MAFCPKCGKQVEIADVFCEHCGFEIGSYRANLNSSHSSISTPDAAKNDPNIGYESVERFDETRLRGSQERRARKKRRIIGGLLFLLVTALLLVGAYFFFYGKGLFQPPVEPEPANQTEVGETTTSRKQIELKSQAEQEGTKASNLGASEATITSQLPPSEATTTRKQIELKPQTEKEKATDSNTSEPVTSVATSEVTTTRKQIELEKPESETSINPVAEAENQTTTESQVIVPIPANEASVSSLYQMIFDGVAGQKAYYYQSLDYQGQKVLMHQASSQADQAIQSASLIKLYVLIAYEEAIEAGQIEGGEIYHYNPADIVGGTGYMQSQPRDYTYGEIAQLMMIASDNMAANVLIERLGGLDVINYSIKQLGYQQTVIQRKFLDQAALDEGKDNYVTAADVADTLRRLYHKELVSARASEEMLVILGQQEDKEKLTRNLPASAKAYHKTGQYEAYGIQNDAAIISGPQGSYILVVLLAQGDRDIQLSALNQFGLDLFNLFNQ